MVLDLKAYQTYAEDFAKAWSYLTSLVDSDYTYEQLAKFRIYNDEAMINTLKEVGFAFLPNGVDLAPLKVLPSYSKLGLETKTGRCLLEGRFAFPVRDMLGNILALIGWFPDERKYITTPSSFFSRSMLYFGMEQLGSRSFQDLTFVCEGIFDAIALRSLGYTAYACMGAELSREKKLMFPLLGKKVVGISDRDKTGTRVREQDKWSCHQYLTWTGEYDMSDQEEENFKIKDIDDLVRLFDPTSLREVFEEALESKNRIVTLKI